MRVVSDTSPSRYLAEPECLPAARELFSTIVVPATVYQELTTPSVPAEVRAAVDPPPDWMLVQPPFPVAAVPGLERLDPGERDAILLGLHSRAELVLIDERRGAIAARTD